ncbi:MAG: DUF2812 domain-containing protein [Oscillospiraceae bacterium]|nr:DUF2812 domain-containing protein [Oscillospiraceae bacterium]
MSEKYVYKKRFHDLENEESWLNEMCAGGLVLKKIEWGVFADKYTFEPCGKKYVCRIDYNPEMEVLDEITSPYVMFVTGTYEAEFICCANGKLYFRKAADKGDFPPIYTSLDSRVAAEKKRLWKTVPMLIIILIESVYIGTGAAVTASGEMFKLSVVCSAICILCFIPILAMVLRHVLKIRSLKKLEEKDKFPPAYTSEEIDLSKVKKEFNMSIICSACWLTSFLIYFISRLRQRDFLDWGSKQFVSDFAPFITVIVLQLGFTVYYLVLALCRRKRIKELEAVEKEKMDK